MTNEVRLETRASSETLATKGRVVPLDGVSAMKADPVPAARHAWPMGMPETNQRVLRTRCVKADDQGGPGGAAAALVQTVVAEDLPGPGTIFLNVDWSTGATVRSGDEITAEVEVIDIRRDKPITHIRVKVTRSDGTVALDGEALCYTIPTRPRRI